MGKRKKVDHINTNHKKASMVIFLSDKVCFETKTETAEKANDQGIKNKQQS